MNEKFIEKLSSITDRFYELERLLGDPEIIANQEKLKEYSLEHHNLQPIVSSSEKMQSLDKELAAAKQMESDPEMQELATEEIQRCTQEKEQLIKELQILLIPSDPDDSSNVFLEIRAGTGGDEAAIFVGDLYRMYAKYAESQRWQVEIITSSPSEHGGFKEIITRVVGKNVYAKLKFESGAHRVQRVPETESQGRIHTSACTVAILKEAKQVDDIAINQDELRIDTFRASGAGGQHVNKTDSAIRITHIPTGVVVECQDDRSQHKNKSKAMTLLHAKLLKMEQDKQKTAEDATRKKLVGSGDRSDRIRTYNFPQGRMTDHRINLTLYKLDELLSGNLDLVVEPLMREYQLDQLMAMGFV